MASLPQRYLSTLSVLSSPNSGEHIIVPGQCRSEGLQFLRAVANGTTVGSGLTFRSDLEQLRIDYEMQIGAMGKQIDLMRTEGKSLDEIAHWAVSERLRIARSIRLRQGPGAMIGLELRDNHQYGLGGRTYSNLARHTLRKQIKNQATDFVLEESLIKGALRPNPALTPEVLRAARYLRYGGPILIVIGAGISAHDVISAAPRNRGRVAAEEVGGWAGGWILSGAAVAIAVVSGVATGGLSLLAIGFLAGAAGGIGGSLLADKIYYSSHPHLVPAVQQTGIIPYDMVQSCMPPPPVCPRCHPR